MTLRVLVVDDAPLATQLEREWAGRGGETKVKNVTTAEFLELNKKPRIGADLVVYPSGLLGELIVAEHLVPVPETNLSDLDYGLRDVFQLLRNQEMLWGKQVFALPLGSPMLELYYRRDLFDEMQIGPPGTWQEYQTTIDKLKKHAAAKAEAGTPVEWQPNLEPLADGWRGLMFLARSAAYARNRSSYSTLFNYATMEPLIDQPSFVKGLTDLIAAVDGNSEACLKSTPADVRRLFYEGKAAMAITWPCSATALPENAKVNPQLVGIAQLPGSNQVYNFRDSKWQTRSSDEPGNVPLLGISGRAASVTKESRHQEEALGLAMWLTGGGAGGGDSTPVLLASDSTFPFRQSQVGTLSRWMEGKAERKTVDEHGKVLEQMHAVPTWLMSPNIPGRTEYLGVLDEIVGKVVRRESPAEAGLTDAASAWRKITEQHDVKSQRQAYELSLGIGN